MPVEWADYLVAHPPVAADSVVAAIETELGCALPADYLAVARANQGRAPTPDCFLLPDGTAHIFNNLIALDPAVDRTANVAALTKELVFMEVLPQRVVLIGDTPNGDFLALDFRNSADAPRIVCVLHDEPGFPVVDVAASFSELLAGLHD